LKKSLLLLLAVFMVLGLALAGCGNDDAGEGGNEDTNTKTDANTDADADTDANTEAEAEQVFRANLHSEPPTIDPGKATDTTSGAIVKAVLEGLTRIGTDGVPHEAAAESIEVSEDFKTYTFTIRDHVWSNGEAVTAYDFEYAWKRVLNPEFPADYAYQLYVIKNAAQAKAGEVGLDEVGVKALDEKTLQVTLENPTPYFLELTAFQTYFPVHKATVEANEAWANDAGEAYVTNGPFKLEKWDHSNELILVKNEDYWDAETVQLDKVFFTMVEDENTELNMYKNGELDWAGAPYSALPTDALPSLKADGSLVTQPIAGTYWYKFNVEKAPFDNVKMRKAFTYAIDRQSIIDNVAQGGQLPAMAITPATMGLSDGSYFEDANLDKATELFNEALGEMGLSSAAELPDITISYNTSEGHAKIAQAIQDQWKKAFGIEVGIENAEWAVYLEKIDAGDYQVGRLGWLGDFNDAINFLEMYQTGGGNNDTNWGSAEFDSLLAQSATEADADKRLDLLKQAEQIMMDEMPVAPIYFYTFNWVKADKVKDVYIDGLGGVDLKWAHIE
jgi:oligopeptide transport system substrate-binding protein